MATITVNVPDRTAERFRKRVAALRGKRKGTLGKAMAEAMENWMENQQHYDSAIQLLDNGWNCSGFTSKTRDDLYEERLNRNRH